MTQAPLTTYLTLCTEFYDLEKPQPDAQELAFYVDYAHHAQGPILEPMCGTGRFLIPLLQAGFDVEGFDASPHMLQALKDKYPNPPAWQAFVQDFTRDKKYQLIFVPFGSWQLITDLNDSQKGLENMYAHLAPGGKLIIEIEPVASLPHGLGMWHRCIHTRADGSMIALNTLPTYDAHTQLFKSICRYESIVGNAITALETEDFLMYLYQFDEFEKLLTKAGFTRIKKYQDYSKTPAYDVNTHLIIYECTK